MIPAEAVEAAARAMHARECGWNDWQYIHSGRGSYEDIARLALEAAAPHMSPQLARSRQLGEEMTIIEFLEARITEDEALAGHSRKMQADCASKRALLTLFRSGIKFEVAAGGVKGWISPLMLMAIPYRDHPDYRQEWEL